MAKKVYDILLTDDDDLQITGGDFVSGESTAQHQKLIILTAKGEWKESPTVGVDAFSYLNDDIEGLEADIAIAFAQDGMKVKSVTLTETGQIDSTATY
jgi:hypothetical protein